MKNKYHYILLFIISIYFSIKVKCDVDVNNQSLNTNFSLKAYTKEDILIQELELTYDYNNKIFFNYLNILLIENAKYFILCSRDYLDKNDDEINMIVLWNTSNIHDFYSTTAYLNAYPMWLKSQKKKFCLKD
ncbi:hypothetical protein BCR36DRAFT_169894 [Piromyces finnis]|uniref:Uncharacterized protein n=1 Tax=Piromyces finnis TaxID=1754191 RepID=A0A1Y1UV33_9FUNG|nr:hypothetical protein BCR36DRAFT_169894 [Piromyces finnis]|eukprot:ORX41867.1 hypothetical protein BCR36DRAFT_169894 [Piromyces finnis]